MGGFVQRVQTYREMDPKMLRREVLPPAAGTAAITLLWTVLFALSLQSGPAVRLAVALAPPLVLGSATAWSRLRRIDRALQRPQVLPELVSSPRLVLRWATADDRNEIRRTMDQAMLDENGWSDALAERSLLALELPSAVLAQRWWVGCDPVTGAIVGCTVLDPDSHRPGQRLLGCWLGPGWRGRGLAAELVRLAVASLRTIEPADAPPVGLATAVHNVAMQRSAIRAGAHEEARYDHTLPNGEVVAGIRYVFPAA